jgi:hypothetical protein
LCGFLVINWIQDAEEIVASKDLGITEADDSLRQGLDELLELEDVHLAKLAASLANPDPAFPDSLAEWKQLRSETELDLQILSRVVPVIRYLLSAWQATGFSLEGVLADLKVSGVPEAKADRCRLLLAPLERAKDKFFVQSLKNRVELMGGPTLDNLNLIWDLRPLFYPSAFPVDSSDDDGTEWVGHTFLLQMEISASRRDGQQESTTLQLSVRDFERFERAMVRARQQLDVLRVREFGG